MIGTATEKALDPTERSAQARQLEHALRARVVGQEEALHAVVSVYQVFLAGMNLPNHPVGTLLFLGPTGSRRASWKRLRKHCSERCGRSSRWTAGNFSTATKSPN